MKKKTRAFLAYANNHLRRAYLSCPQAEKAYYYIAEEDLLHPYSGWTKKAFRRYWKDCEIIWEYGYFMSLPEDVIMFMKPKYFK